MRFILEIPLSFQLVDVSFAVGAGSFNGENKEKGAGGIGGKMTQVQCW